MNFSNSGLKVMIKWFHLIFKDNSSRKYLKRKRVELLFQLYSYCNQYHRTVINTCSIGHYIQKK